MITHDNIACLHSTMVFRHISEDLKLRALWLRGQGFISDDICYLLGFSSRSLSRWQSNMNTYGSVIPPRNPLQGRPSVLNAEQRNQLFDLLDQAPEMFLDEIQDWVALYQDTAISRTALHDIIQDAGLTFKMLHKAASERDEVAREEFRTYIREHLVVDQVITADESSKDDRTIFRRFGRAPQGHQASIDADFVRGDHYSIVAAMSINGYMATRVVPGSVDGDEFFEFIVEDVVSNYLV
jgi:transposase